MNLMALKATILFLSKVKTLMPQEKSMQMMLKLAYFDIFIATFRDQTKM